MYFLRGLVNAGFQVHLITPGDGILPAEGELDAATVTRVPLDPEADFLQRAVAYGEAVMRHVSESPRYDLVHYRSMWSGLGLAQARNRLGYKTLFEVNGLPSVELKYHYPGLRESGLLTKIREQELATLMLSDALVTPSGVTRAFLSSLGVPRSRVTVIPNGFNPAEFYPQPLPPEDGHIPEILYVGTLADWQGLEVMVSALPRILAERPVRLRILGQGRSRQRKALLKRIQKLGLEEHVCLDEPVPHHQVPQVIARADLCVAPLALNDRNVTQGCCPIKVIEYMACGRPLVASNLPVVRELVREDVDGLLFAPDDPEDLALQVLALLGNRSLAERLASSAAEHARRKLTWKKAQQRLVSVYQGLLGAQ